ncbi:hypothetical protein F5Y04DRAFT_182311 [Hypomontagnella monticulosa]|nr:hypothetical protein F5Y04DRAFT_182311 [Hypomontagnella monticulosa]
MAPHRVIADSDDEDEVDNPLGPPQGNIVGPPEIEPLSPYHRPSMLPGHKQQHHLHNRQSSFGVPDNHNHRSNSTDQSFFAGIYDEHQSRALQQSQLIEHIVRQSQQASRSSGDVSLPAIGKGRKDGASSATNITSPELARKPRNQPSLFTDSASGITTPRKSAPGEWDVPSSAESLTGSPNSARKIMLYGPRRRNLLNALKNPAEIFIRDDITAREPDMHDETLHPVHPSLQSESKGGELSAPSAGVPDLPVPGRFYVSQDDLTTAQKWEKLEIQVPLISQLRPSGYAANQKSSGMTTIAYSTPSRYASSGLPLPCEENYPGVEPDENPNVIDISSSRDVIGGDLSDTRMAMVNGHKHTDAEQNEREVMNEDDNSRNSSNMKRNKRARATQDEDELVQDGYLDPEMGIDRHRVNHKRQRNQRASNSPSSHKDVDDFALTRNLPVEAPPTVPRKRFSGGGLDGVNEVTYELPTTETLVPIDVYKQLETEATPQPKKRGRKKKQPMSTQTIQDEQPAENHNTAREHVAVPKDSDAQAEPEKPKRKRGRPRKSDSAKPETGVVPKSQVAPVPEAHKGASQRDELSLDGPEVVKPKLKKRQPAQKQGEEHEASNDPSLDGARDTSPLKEISSNPKTPSQKSTSMEDAPTESASKPATDQTSEVKRQEKADPTPKPTPMSSQPKVPYRVGLSKRTRITSLLKSIRR